MSHNFSAGPNPLPKAVQQRLLEAAETYPGTDISAWSISHRDQTVHDAFDRCAVLVREILGVPNNFEILLTQGGATGMFKAWPMNICPELVTVDIVRSGHWANEAYRGLQEVQTSGLIKIGTELPGWDSVIYPTKGCTPLSGDILYAVTNETVNGTQLPRWELLPRNAPPLVVDMSSDIMMRPIDFSRIGLVFASTQKNLGMTAGFCLVIVRKDLMEGEPHPLLPAPLSFQEQLKHRGGLRNTVNPLGILSMLYILEWIKEQGGVETMQAQAEVRAQIVYDAIDSSEGYFEGLAPPEFRSTANVTFRVSEEGRRMAFLEFCTHRGFVGLKGHAALAKTAGPHARASMYVGATVNDAEALVAAMEAFRP